MDRPTGSACLHMEKRGLEPDNLTWEQLKQILRIAMTRTVVHFVDSDTWGGCE